MINTALLFAIQMPSNMLAFTLVGTAITFLGLVLIQLIYDIVRHWGESDDDYKRRTGF